MIIRRLIELLAPAQCVGCGSDNTVLCSSCLQAAAGAQVVRFPDRPDFFAVSVGAHYEGPVRELILQLKFHRQQSASEAAASLVVRGLPSDWAADVVTAVPVSGRRYRERGYNQSGLLARRVAAALGLPYTPLLGRTTSAHQLGVDRRTRLAQVRGVFFSLRRLDGQRVLVVDDVVTTGATLAECATVFTAAGAGGVRAAVVARNQNLQDS